MNALGRSADLEPDRRDGAADHITQLEERFVG